MIEQDARTEARELAAQAGVIDDWFEDMLTAKLMKWYHRGGLDAMDLIIAKLGPHGETNIVKTLQETDRIVP